MSLSIASARLGVPAAPVARPSPFRTLLWPLLRPYRRILLLGVVLNAAHGFGVAYQNLVPKFLIDDVLAGGSDGLAWRIAGLVTTFMVVSIVGRMALWHLSLRLFTHARELAMLELRARFFAHVNHLCLRFHGKHESGELFNVLFGSPAAKVQDYLRQLLLLGPGAALSFIITLAWVGLWDLPMMAVLALTVLLYCWVMMRCETRVQDLWRDYQQTEGQVSAVAADLLRGHRAVKLHGMEQRTEARFRAQLDGLRAKIYQVDVHSHWEWMKPEVVGYACFALLCGIGAWRHHLGLITTGELMAFIGCFFGLQWPLSTFFQIAMLRGGARASLERIAAVLDTPSTTPDPAAAEPVPRHAPISISGLDFAYERDPVLRRLDLTIPYGQKVAFVGPSGSGKTTLSALVLRLLDPDQGSVALGGVDLRRLRGADLRRRFGVVPQDPFLFRTTVRDNVRVAKPEADDGEIRRALEMANAWDFVARLPDGLDNLIGEGGSTLSGGQRQRLAIARALLADPDWFIFDEATSALDTVSERAIQDALEHNLGGRTAIFIAHRLATVRGCDRIIVLKDGVVVQDGSYAELAGRDGLFSELVRGQSLAQ